MRALRDVLSPVLAGLAGVATIFILAIIIGHLASAGGAHLSIAYLTTSPTRAGLQGGIASVLINTVAILGVTLAVVVPVGTLAGVLLFERTRNAPRLTRAVRRSLDVLAGVPSIVFGLFGMKLFCEVLGMGWSILAGGLTLACMALPFLVRATEEGLRGVDAEQPLACAALGTSRVGALWHVLVPAAAPSIVAGIVLGIGRALAETAAVMFTAGAAMRMPESLLDPGRALAYHVYMLAIEVPGGGSRAASAALVLVVLVSLTTVLANAAARTFIGRSA